MMTSWWHNLQRKIEEYTSITRHLRRIFQDEFEKAILTRHNGDEDEFYDRAYQEDANFLIEGLKGTVKLYGIPVVASITTLGMLRFLRRRNTRISKSLTTSNPFEFHNNNNTNNNKFHGWIWDFMGSTVLVGLPSYWMMKDCGYISRKLNKPYYEMCERNFLAPGTSHFTDTLCLAIVESMQQIRHDETINQDLLKNPSLRSLQEWVNNERKCHLRLAYQKQLQKKQGISDDSPLLCSVPIPHPGVPNDDRLLLAEEEEEAEEEPEEPQR